MFLGGYAGDKAKNTHKRAVLELVRKTNGVELSDIHYLPYPAANFCVRRYETKVLNRERGDRLDKNRVVFVGQVPNLLPKCYVAWAIDAIAEEYALDFFLQTLRNGCAKAWVKTPVDRDRLIARNRAALFDIRGVLIARTRAARDLLVEYTDNIARYNPDADNRVPHQCMVFEKPRRLAGTPDNARPPERMADKTTGSTSAWAASDTDSDDPAVASRCIHKHPVEDKQHQRQQEKDMEAVLKRQLDEQLQQVRIGFVPGQPLPLAAPVAPASELSSSVCTVSTTAAKVPRVETGAQVPTPPFMAQQQQPQHQQQHHRQKQPQHQQPHWQQPQWPQNFPGYAPPMPPHPWPNPMGPGGSATGPFPPPPHMPYSQAGSAPQLPQSSFQQQQQQGQQQPQSEANDVASLQAALERERAQRELTEMKLQLTLEVQQNRMLQQQLQLQQQQQLQQQRLLDAGLPGGLGLGGGLGGLPGGLGLGGGHVDPSLLGAGLGGNPGLGGVGGSGLGLGGFTPSPAALGLNAGMNPSLGQGLMHSGLGLHAAGLKGPGDEPTFLVPGVAGRGSSGQAVSDGLGPLDMPSFKGLSADPASLLPDNLDD